MNPAAIILAGGYGKRVASLGAKPFLTCAGKTFIEMIVEKISQINIDSIIIVTNSQLERKMRQKKFAAQIVINPQPERGMLSSLICGLNLVPKDATGILMNPVDFPLVESETYQALIKLHVEFPGCIIKPIYKRKSGHPVIFPWHLFAELGRAPLDQGARFVVRKFPHLIKTIVTNDEGVVININTPEMYKKWCGC